MKNKSSLPGIMPNFKNVSDEGEALSPSVSPISEVSAGANTSDLKESLADDGFKYEAPDPKPIIETTDSKISSVIDVKAPKGAIEVVALGKGFYNQRRLVEGDLFKVNKWEDLARWMKCVDPDLQKQHVQSELNKKKARK